MLVKECLPLQQPAAFLRYLPHIAATFANSQVVHRGHKQRFLDSLFNSEKFVLFRVITSRFE